MIHELHVYDAICCRTWPMLVGVRSGRCVECGAVPVRIGNDRIVRYDDIQQRPPKLVATVAREAT